MVQEPYVGAKACISIAHRVIQKNTSNRDRPVKAAIIIVDRNVQVTENPDIISENLAACTIGFNRKKIGLISVYLEKEKDIEEDLLQIERQIRALNADSVIIAGDFNAKSPWWGGSAEDARGTTVAEFLARLDLHVLNTGETPTFYTVRNNQPCTSIVDITLCSSSILHRIKKWHVDSNLVTLSDHRAVRFKVNTGELMNSTSIRQTTRKYNTSKADWLDFARNLTNILTDHNITDESIKHIRYPDELEVVTRKYVSCVTEACNKAIPKISSIVHLGRSEWWTEELTQKKREMIRLRNKIRKANPRRRPFVINEYVAAKQDYKRILLNTITKSWKLFCERQGKETLWEGVYRIIRKSSTAEGDRLLRSPHNQEILSARESAELLTATFYPLDNPTEDSLQQMATRESAQREMESLQITEVIKFTILEVESVLASMCPKKSPGMDGITADICLKAFRSNPMELLGLYNKCLELAYFPKIWKEAIIKIIPKPHREDYTVPKSYRPIGLLPVFGKVLEKMFSNRIMWQLGHESSMSPRQYGFMPQKSTEDALHDAMEIIDDAYLSGNIAVAVSLDIEGAFDNAWWPSIKLQLLRKHIEPAITKLVESFLSDRSVIVRYSGEEVQRNTNKGCIQGSTSGPLLWNLLLDSLLEETARLRAHVQAFADDILLVGTGKDGEGIERELNRALDIISAWGRRNKLRFAPQKTQVTIFTRKLKYHLPKLILEGTQLSMGDTLKILGLTLDKNLSYLPHIKQNTEKVINLYKGVSRTARAHWGLNPEVLRTIYFAVIEPTILYAANVWGKKANTKQIRKKLDRITRMFGIMLSKAHRTTSLTSSTLLARILPLDLRAAEKMELYKIKKGKIFPELPGRELEKNVSPYSLPHPARRKLTLFDLIESQADLEIRGGQVPRIFTDGSKIEGKVGAAWSVWEEAHEARYCLLPLASYCSVFQAELCAILGAIKEMNKAHRFRKGTIFSDSRSALEAIGDPSSLHPLVAEIHNQMHRLHEVGGNVEFCWIRAHVGIPGNERADELAKQAALKCKKAIIYDSFPISYAKRLLREQTLEKWQKRYEETATGSTTKLFFPYVKEAYKTLDKIVMNNLKAQLLTGHGGFRSYLHRFKLINSPFCACDDNVVETVEHIVVECPRFAAERFDCEHRMDKDIRENNLSDLVNNEDYRSEFLDFAFKVASRAARANGSIV